MRPFSWNEINGREEDDKLRLFFHAETDLYAVFQLKQQPENMPMAFVSYSDWQRRGEKPEFERYEMVYLAPLNSFQDSDTMLEEIYMKFNVDRPEDFTGHSLSVSDVVALRTGQQMTFHYVDPVGFTQLPEFMKSENYLKYAEMSMEDDYGMIDGIINNGKRTDNEDVLFPGEAPGKSSILDELQKAKDITGELPEKHRERDL